MKRSELCVSDPLCLAESKARSVDFGVFLVGGGDLGWGQVLLETWGKLAALPFFFFFFPLWDPAPPGWVERGKLN